MIIVGFFTFICHIFLFVDKKYFFCPFFLLSYFLSLKKELSKKDLSSELSKKDNSVLF